MSEQKLPLRDRRLTAVTFGVAVFIVVLDQFTKYLAVTYLQNRPPVEVIGTWLQLTFLRNPGAAFSVGTSYTFIFTGIAIAVVVVIVRTSRNLGSLWWEELRATCSTDFSASPAFSVAMSSTGSRSQTFRYSTSPIRPSYVRVL